MKIAEISHYNSDRGAEVFSRNYNALAKATDRLFGYLFIFQWLLGIVFALFISPRTWEGEYSQVHFHVYVAIFLGGLVAVVPVFLVFTNPGATINRMVVAVSQILFSVLLIHLTGGRIETHFHVFGSLAFLASYRDWRPVLIGTAVTGADHLIRGIFWPQSVYGVLSSTPWRALEHTAWVVFEDLILLYSSRLSLAELRFISEVQVKLESALTTAEKANQAKSLFLANISHELRTPMHGVLSFARFGQQKILTVSSEKLKSYFDEIFDSGSRLMRLLNDLLDLSKLEAGKMSYNMQDGDLLEMLHIVRSEMMILATEKNIGIEIHCDQTAVPAKFDQERLGQVLQNLLSNAIKFSDMNTTVDISLQRTSKGTRCSVTNQGVGIPATELEFIFDKFVQSSKTRTGSGGTGLGLAICKEIVEHCGGTIWAESDPNGLTKFTFELPLTLGI